MLSFSVIQNDQVTRARVGRLRMTRAEIATPAFMPVGSLGNVRGVDAEELRKMGYGLMLNNAYHLYLRPGYKLIADMGGLHAFTTWPGAILTDSGGYQVFSLAKFCKVTDAGATFQSHIDGSTHFISPETAIEIQEGLGADIIMAFDHCVALPSTPDQVEDAARRTVHWARRCLDARRRDDQILFGIVQGGLNPNYASTSHETWCPWDSRDMPSAGCPSEKASPRCTACWTSRFPSFLPLPRVI